MGPEGCAGLRHEFGCGPVGEARDGLYLLDADEAIASDRGPGRRPRQRPRVRYSSWTRGLAGFTSS